MSEEQKSSVQKRRSHNGSFRFAGGSCGREAPAASEASQLASEASKVQALKLHITQTKNYT